MGLSCGIVGLPNVGKSTFFNALTKSFQAAAANYPFCTIEPNRARVPIHDARLTKLAGVAKSKKIIEDTLEFVDIAGLVRGASKGEGLGNAFLSHIRTVDLILHVVRCFEGEVTHVEGSVDPIRDLQTIRSELVLADMIVVEGLLGRLDKRKRAGNVSELEAALLPRIMAFLEGDQELRKGTWTEEERAVMKPYAFLTLKPAMVVCNVAEDGLVEEPEWVGAVRAFVKTDPVFALSAQFESECAGLDPEETAVMFEAWGLKTSGLDQVVQASNTMLNRISFFTVGPQEARSWGIPKGTTAQAAAGEIHSDLSRGFISAETIAYEDYIAHNGESGVRAAGKLKTNGRHYLVQDGDALHVLFNV